MVILFNVERGSEKEYCMEELFLMGFIGLFGCFIGYIIGKYNEKYRSRCVYLKRLSNEIKHARQRGFLDGYYTYLKRIQNKQQRNKKLSEFN